MIKIVYSNLATNYFERPIIYDVSESASEAKWTGKKLKAFDLVANHFTANRPQQRSFTVCHAMIVNPLVFHIRNVKTTVVLTYNL